MADESKETEELEETEPAAEEPEEPEEPEADGVDWKALARKWERQAKANAKKAAEADALKAEKARAGWVASVAKETGVPADVLRQFSADSEDDLKAKAEAVAEHFKKDALPVVPGDGKQPKEAAADDKRSFVRQLMGKED